MNRKGFTLIELLAVITIIAMISTVGVVSYTNIIATSADKVFEEYQDSMYVAAANYMNKNYMKLRPSTEPGHEGHIYKKLTIDELGIETIKNPKNDNNCKANSYVEIEENENCDVKSFKYNVCLKCGNDYDNCKKFFYDDCTA